MSDLSKHIAVRRASIDDAPTIASILYESFKAYKPLYTPEGFATTTPDADVIRLRWHEGPVWIVSHNETLVGTVAVIHEGSALYIRSMAVLPDHRGRGIASKLLLEIEDYARTKAFKCMYLYTTPFLHEAIALYERFGFHQHGELLDLGGTPLIMMEKGCKG